MAIGRSQVAAHGGQSQVEGKRIELDTKDTQCYRGKGAVAPSHVVPRNTHPYTSDLGDSAIRISDEARKRPGTRKGEVSHQNPAGDTIDRGA
ncbi:hypothetical protein GCM10027563_06780 [Parasphingorhabdus pacifica]